VGGRSNSVSASYSFVGGGKSNTASGACSFVGGGLCNQASGCNSFVGGGCGNTASAAWSGAFGCNLNACNACTFYTNNIFSCGDIYATGNITACSDSRVKENIRPIENVLSRINCSRGVVYDRIDTKAKNEIGFIAQELEVNFPELVKSDNGDNKFVNYQSGVAVVFEGLKEQQKIIDKQGEIINKQGEEIKQLKADVIELKTIINGTTK
jgi:hypothetical protein